MRGQGRSLLVRVKVFTLRRGNFALIREAVGVVNEMWGDVWLMGEAG